MATATEMARVKREVEALARAIEQDLRSRTAMSAAQRQLLRSDIEACVQRLDELRNRLSR